MQLDLLVRRLAETQHAVVADHQARALGFNPDALHRRRQTDEWEALSPHVIRLVGAPVTDAQRAMAAVLDAGPGAFLSHASAAAWWRLPGFRLKDLEVSRPRTGARRPARLAKLHQPRYEPDGHLLVVEAVPVASPALTIFQLAATEHPLRVERACDNALAMELVATTSLHTLLEDLAARGRTGIGVIRPILEARPPGYVAPESGVERRFARILVQHDEPPMHRQRNIGNDHRFIGRIDFADRKLPLVVRIQSERYHSSLLDRNTDLQQRTDLEALGFTILDFTDYQVWYEPYEVVKQVRLARMMLRAVS